MTSPLTCRHCLREIEDKADPCMSGAWPPRWVHVPGGYSICFPQERNSPRAEPQQD